GDDFDHGRFAATRLACNTINFIWIQVKRYPVNGPYSTGDSISLCLVVCMEVLHAQESHGLASNQAQAGTRIDEFVDARKEQVQAEEQDCGYHCRSGDPPPYPCYQRPVLVGPK